jgi:ATP-binding cassette subfamily C protein LapB
MMTQTQRQAARELQRIRERELASIDEMFRGVLSLKAHRAFDFGVERWLASKNAYECALQKWSTVSVVQGLAGLSFERMSLAIVLGAGAYEVVRGRLSVGQLVMANMLLRQISMQVRQIAPLLQRRTAFRASQAGMVAFLARKQGRTEAGTVLRVAIDIAVVARNLKFSTSDGRVILDGIGFELPLGKSLAILGESGSGKTTLLKLLSGLYQPSAGVVLVQGVPPAARSDLVYLSQKEHLFSCGIAENMTLGRPTERVVEQSLHHLDLGKILIAEHQAAEAGGPLSGGERQRIFVARALAQPDTGLFLDEPTTALDSDRRAGVMALLRSAASERKAVVFATHDSELAAIADYTLCISRGRVISFGRRQSTDPAKQQASAASAERAEKRGPPAFLRRCDMNFLP